MIHEQEQEQETGKGQSKDERNGEGCLDAKTMPDSDSDDGPGGTVGDRRRRSWGRVLVGREMRFIDVVGVEAMPLVALRLHFYLFIYTIYNL